MPTTTTMEPTVAFALGCIVTAVIAYAYHYYKTKQIVAAATTVAAASAAKKTDTMRNRASPREMSKCVQIASDLIRDAVDSRVENASAAIQNQLMGGYGG